MIEFRILNEPKQKFSVLLNQRRLTFTLWYNGMSDRWSMDVAVDDVPVLHGRRVVPGVDLLDLLDLGVGVVVAWSDTGAEPNRDNLPLGLVKLYHATEEEVNAAVAA